MIARVVTSYSACGDVDVLLVEVTHKRDAGDGSAWAVLELVGDDQARAIARTELERGRAFLRLLGEVRWFGDELEARTWMEANER